MQPSGPLLAVLNHIISLAAGAPLKHQPIQSPMTALRLRHFATDYPGRRSTVDFSADQTPVFTAEPRGISSQDTAYRLTSRWNPRSSFDYAFSPTCNSADLKGTPHPPIPQNPFGFFARYCW